MTICERVFDLLKNSDKTQADLAAVLGVRQNTVSEWKRTGRNPAAEYIEPIAAFFDVSVDYIVTGRERLRGFVQQGIFGDSNHDNTVTIGVDGAVRLSEFQSELLRIYDGLSTKNKNTLLAYAYELEGKNGGLV